MITKFLLNLLLTILSAIMNLITALIPSLNIQESTTGIVSKFFEMTTQAKNFAYFMIGDTLYIILDAVLLLITFKYVVYPVYVLIRKLFIKD